MGTQLFIVFIYHFNVHRISSGKSSFISAIGNLWFIYIFSSLAFWEIYQFYWYFQSTIYLLVNYFPSPILESSLCYGEVSRNILWRLFFPSSCHSHKGVFLWILPWETVGFLEMKLTELWGLRDHQEFLTLRLIHTQPPEICPNYHINIATS